MPNIYTYSFSVIIFILSFLIFSKNRISRKNKLLFCVLAFLYIFLCIVHEVSDYFTGTGIDITTIVQIKFGLQGAAFSAYTDLIILITLVLVISIVSFTIFIIKDGKRKTNGSVRLVITAYLLLAIALISNPATINLYNLPTGTLLSSSELSESAIAEFYTYYKKPQIRPLKGKPKNIIFIYAESLEHAFFNEKVFPDLVPRLKEIEEKSISFTNMTMAHGTGGTIWAISASQCGLPLFMPNLAILNHGTGDFLPSATCLGDLLEDEGYYLTYYGGADLLFTGKGHFFNSHGFADVFGKDELIPKLVDKDYLNFWGIYDDSLFDITYERFLELSATGKKFGLFMLTLDTHSPGYSSKSCDNILYQDGDNKYLNAVACSDYLISKFIRKILKSPYAQQTLIVLASDHVNWNDCPASELLKIARDGHDNIFMIIDPDTVNGKEVTTKGTAFDIGTTILPFIGYSGRIGLGRDLNAESKRNDEERSYIQKRIHSWKPEIVKFWGQPKIRRSLSIDITNNIVSIDRKSYNIPIFIELTNDLESVLLFGFNGTCTQYLQKMKSDKKFVLVEECSNIKFSDKIISDQGEPMATDGLCLVIGDEKEYSLRTKLDSNVHYSRSELLSIIGVN